MDAVCSSCSRIRRKSDNKGIFPVSKEIDNTFVKDSVLEEFV
jgi:hypothetical protein